MNSTDIFARMKPLLDTVGPARTGGQEEANKALVARMFLEIVNQKAYDVADEIFAEDFHWPQFGLTGPEGVKTWARGFHAGWPDVQDRIELQVAQGEWVVSLVSVAGTQSGGWAGLPPSDTFHAFPAIGIDRVRDGRIVERCALFDFADVALALGHALPADTKGIAE